MKKIKSLSISLLFSCLVFSQQINYFGRTYSDTLPETFKLDVSKLREHIYSSIPDELKKGDLERSCFLFADKNAYSISKFISKGNVYSDWSSLENYINDILKKVTPEDLRNDSVIHAYIVQDGLFNAFMTASGHTFINIGIFSNVNNEATIAGILAHELAHYYLQHSLKSFIEIENGNINPNKKSGARYSQSQERQADSLSIRWLQISGYSINGVIDALEINERLENNEINRLPNKWEIEETTHPNAKERMARLHDYYDKNKENTGKRFIISEEQFLKFKEGAKPEILKHLLNSFNYSTCIEEAFKFHLFDPDNGIYIYYLMEAIRRNCYLNSDLWNKLFITNRYYESKTRDNGTQYKIPITDHLFKKFNLDVLPLDVFDTNKIAKFYWQDTPKFTSYNEAFEFFYRLSKGLKINECTLSNALSITSNKEVRDKLLKTYLSFENIKYRNFAENLLAGTITNKLAKKKLIVYFDINAIVKQGQDEIPIRIKNYGNESEMTSIFDSAIIGYENYRNIFLPNLQNFNLNEYNELYDLMIFSRHSLFAKGEKTELHILDPKYWGIFLNYDVNEIEFMSCSYYEMRKREKSKQAYEEVINADYKSIFNQSKRTRVFNVFLSSVREIEDGVMKLNTSNKFPGLKFNEPGYPQMISEVKYTIRQYDKRVKEIDYNYKNNPDQLEMY